MMPTVKLGLPKGQSKIGRELPQILKDGDLLMSNLILSMLIVQY